MKHDPNEIKRAIIEILSREQIMTINEIANHVGIHYDTADKYLIELTDENRVYRIKKNKKNGYSTKFYIYQSLMDELKKTNRVLIDPY